MGILKYYKFLESSLNIPTLDTKTKGIKRGDILIQRLTNDDTVIDNKTGKSITIDKIKDEEDNWSEPVDAIDVITSDGEYDSDKAKKYFTKPNGRFYKDVFMDEDGKVYKLNDIKKDKEFGSSGAGVLTREYESIQSLFIAYGIYRPYSSLSGKRGDYGKDAEVVAEVVSLLNRFKEKESDLMKRLELHLKDIDVISTEMIELLSDNIDWFATFNIIPGALLSMKVNGDFLISMNKNYSLYHVSTTGDSPVETLKQKYKVLSKNKWKIDFSKYCPADLYIVVKEEVDNVKKTINSANSIEELTNSLNDLFESGKFIPISLKKIGAGANTFKLIINNEKSRELPDFRIERFIITNDANKGIASKIETESIWKSKEGEEIESDERVLGIDSSNTNKKQNVDGEVEGKYSRHGKISFTSMKYFLEKGIREEGLSISTKLQDIKELIDMDESILDDMISDLHYRVKKLGHSQPSIKVDSILRGRNLDSKTKKISKIQSLQILLIIEELMSIDEDIANSVVTNIMRYALSIQTDSFTTPRYIRII